MTAIEQDKISLGLARAVLHSRHIPVALLDIDHNYISVSPAFAAANDLAPGDFPGRNYFDFNPNAFAREILAAAATTGAPALLPPRWPAATEPGDADGAQMAWQVLPIKGGGGDVVALGLIGQEAAAPLEATGYPVGSGSFFDAIMEYCSDVIAVLAPDGEVQFVSASVKRVLGLNPEDLLGRRAFDLVDPIGDLEDGPGLAQLTESSDQVISFHAKLRHGDDRELEAVAVNLVKDHRIGGILLTVRDMTEREAAEKRLRETQKLKALGQLTAGIAHDFNNLLAIILGNAELVEEQMSRHEFGDVAALTERIRTAAERGGTLVNHLLGYARKQSLNPANTDLASTLRQMDGMLRWVLGEQVKIDYRIAAGTWTCFCDTGRFHDAIVNLALNARDAMPAGGRFLIACDPLTVDVTAAKRLELAPGEYLALRFTDTGFGMSPETVDRAFEPFYTSKSLGSGCGLGLSMVYGFVRQSGGQMEIDSAEGFGTTILMYLPRVVDMAGDLPAKPVDDPPLAGYSILVVEDDPDVREVAVRQLVSLGVNCYAASDGTSARTLVGELDHLDLLLCDVVLAGGETGPDVLDLIREVMPDIKVLYMSGYAPEEIANGRLELSEADLLAKPFTLGNLRDRVMAVLA